MTAMRPDEQHISNILESMSPEERDRTLRDLLRQQQTSGGDDTRKIEDALLLLRMRPKVMVTTYIPLTKRYAERPQDRKVWDLGIIDPLADEDIPGRPQIVRVVSIPDGEVLFERQEVLGLPGMAEPVRVAVPPPPERRISRPTSADLDEGSAPAPPPMVAGVTVPAVTPDEFEDGPEVGQGPQTVPVDPQVLTDLMARLESLEEENARLKAAQAETPEPETAGRKAAGRRRGKEVREPTPGARDAAAAEGEPEAAKQPEPVGS